TTAGTAIFPNGILELDGGISVRAETLETVRNSGPASSTAPTLRSVNGTNEWDGHVTWGAFSEGGNPDVATRVEVARGSELRMGGSVSGVGAWEKTGAGDLTLFAVAGGLNFIPNNDYTGTFTVRNGRVNLDKFGSLTALSGPLVIGDGTAGAAPQV